MDIPDLDPQGLELRDSGRWGLTIRVQIHNRSTPFSKLLSLLAGQLALPALFDWEEDLCPEIACISKVVCNADVRHARF